jgi:2-methylisocitrate lyase-like PEP mutase family enzyme
LLSEPGIVITPGVYDSLSARLAEQFGFQAINIGGATVANAILGLPDVGLVTLTEMTDQVRRITAATTIPSVADADTGYGNEINVMRTVREYEAAGAAALHIEDQVIPKRCGHFDGKEVVPAREMANKIRAAVEARTDPDFMIIARTDARAVEGFEATVERSNVYLAAGADMIYFEAPRTEDELRRVPKLVRGPVLANMVSGGGKTPLTSAADLAEMGFKMVNYGAATMQAAMYGVLGFYEELRATGTPAGYLDRLTPFDERQRRIGLPEMLELQQRFQSYLESEN